MRCQKNSKLAQKENKEGKTYQSNIGLNLQVNPEETSFYPLQITEKVTKNQHVQYEKLAPELWERPPNRAISYDAELAYKFILFDTETTTKGMQAEICQLSAVDDDVQNQFSHYIAKNSPA